MSPFLTGPFTFLTRVLFILPRNVTLTCVIPPLEPTDKQQKHAIRITLLRKLPQDHSPAHSLISAVGTLACILTGEWTV